MPSWISGFSIVRNAVKLKYPLRECLEALHAVSDEVVLGIDPTTEDGTWEWAKELSAELGTRLFESPWDMDNFDGGKELGIQTQKTLEQCNLDWTLYVQMDEALCETDGWRLENLVKRAPDDVTGFFFIRPYFWQNLHTIRKDWSIPVTRLTRKGTHDYTTLDGHSCITQRGRVEKSEMWLFHYSRIGDGQTIAQRVRNLDGFYHSADNLIAPEYIPDYDFQCRQWDNYSLIEFPPEVEGEFVEYHFKHPAPFARLYADYP